MNEIFLDKLKYLKRQIICNGEDTTNKKLGHFSDRIQFN